MRYRVQRQHPNLASPTSGKILLKLHQPFDNHNGGHIAFGPDGLLYAGFGDGGSGGDPNHNGQRRTGLLSKIVRMNVYAKKPVARVYAYGFRNPGGSRSTAPTATCGSATSARTRGRRSTGFRRGLLRARTSAGATTRAPTSTTAATAIPSRPPAWCSRLAQYPHTPATGPANCSITGGYVYRGPGLPSLRGYYLYADYCSGRIWRRRATGGRPSEMGISRKVTNISSFGQGSGGGLYVISLNGSIYRIGS